MTDVEGLDPSDPAAAGDGADDDRRRFLQRASRSTAGLFAAGFAGGLTAHGVGHAFASEGTDHAATYESTHGPAGLRIYDAAAPGGSPFQIVGGAPTAANAVYGHGAQSPMGVTADHLDALTIAPPRDGKAAGTLREYAFDVIERSVEIGAGIVAEQWTYNGSAPGPIIRATVGDRLRIRVRNLTPHAHNLHLHGRHHVSMDGWEPIPPGSEFTYEVTAGPVGLFPYHCHTSPLAEHIGRGLYGAMIIDPVEPREQAHEIVLLLSGWDLDGDGRNEYWTYNGMAGFFMRHPIKVPVGDLVRVHLLNMVEYDPLASFHLHAETFDVFRSGATTPSEHTDTVTLSQGERAIVEFRLPEPGRYMFHPHQHHMADGGAMGWFAAV